MRVCTLGLIAALILPTFATSAEPKRAAGTETLSANGFVVASINIAQLWDAESLAGLSKALRDNKQLMVKSLKKEIGLDLADIERITLSMPAFPITPDGEVPPVVYVTSRKAFDVSKVMKAVGAVTVEEARKKLVAIHEEIQGKNVYVFEDKVYVAIDDRTFAMTSLGRDGKAPISLLADLKAGKPVLDGPLAEALALAPKHTVVAAVDFAPVRKLLEGTPEVPADYKALTEMAQAEQILFTADFGAKLSANAKLTFFDADTAKKVQPSAKKVFALGQSFLAESLKQKNRDPETKLVVDPILEFFSTALEKGEAVLDGKVLTLSASGAIDASLKKSLEAFPAWASVTADRVKTANNLKQIVLAVHNFESANGFLPADILDKNGKAILSWRVHLLPYLEQAQIYNKLDLTKPWDDAANKEFLEQMPEVFKVAGREPKEKGFTYFQSFSAEKEIEGGSPFLVKGAKRTFVGITDGSSNTLAVVDGATAVNWMKPGDLPYDPKKLPKVGKDGWMFAGFGDGSVRRIKIPKDDALKALITINGGEVVTLDE